MTVGVNRVRRFTEHLLWMGFCRGPSTVLGSDKHWQMKGHVQGHHLLGGRSRI
jgi:hypothetical protein